MLGSAQSDGGAASAKKEAARLLAALACKKWGPAHARQRILGVPMDLRGLGTLGAFAGFCNYSSSGGRTAACDYCGDGEAVAHSQFVLYDLRDARLRHFEVAVSHGQCLAGFLRESAAAHRRYELYLTLRAGTEDPGSPFGRLPRELFGLLWAWCARLFVWEA
jgi:hypothetical protein